MDGAEGPFDWQPATWLVFVAFVNNLLQLDKSDECSLLLLEVRCLYLILCHSISLSISRSVTLTLCCCV